MIDILIPVLGRPHRVEPLVENIAAATTVPYNLLFLASSDDHETQEAITKAGANFEWMKWPPAKGQYAKKINLGYRKTEHPWLLLGADDVVFHPGWAEAALKAAGDNFHVVATNDKANYFVRQGLLATHSLIRRTYVDAPGASLDGPGVIYHEGYSHNFVDCELSVLARQRGAFVFARTAVLEHQHPAFGRAPHDSIYEHGFRDFGADRDLFVERTNEWARDPLVRRFAQAVRVNRNAAVRAARRRARQRR